MPITDDLLPCPFCGEAAYEQAHEHTHMYLGFIPEHGGSYTVECTACSAGVIEDARDKARALWNRRTVAEGMAMVPESITAESGHKAALMGEFIEVIDLPCPECTDLDGEDEDCEICGGAGEYIQRVNVNWTTIKDIHRRIVEITEAEVEQP